MNLTPRYTEEDLERAKQQGRDEVMEWALEGWQRGHDFAIKQGNDIVSHATHRGFWWGFAAGAALATAVVAVWAAGGAA